MEMSFYKSTVMLRKLRCSLKLDVSVTTFMYSCVTYNYMIWSHIHKIGNVLYMPPSSGDTSVLQITCVLNVCHIWYDG